MEASRFSAPSLDFSRLKSEVVCFEKLRPERTKPSYESDVDRLAKPFLLLASPGVTSVVLVDEAVRESLMTLSGYIFA